MTPVQTAIPTSGSPPPVLEMRGISKRYPGVLALDRIDLRLRPGEVLALMGENGAGKSTLMNILGGIQQPDHGDILVDGAPQIIRNVAAAKALGIAFVHQELMLAPNLDIASNLFLGSELQTPLRRLDRRRMESQAHALLVRIGLDASPRTLVSSLTPGQMQMVEICRALKQNARILVLDEPTSSLSLSETSALLRVVKELRTSGVSIIYISHRLAEVFQIADRVAVMRDGRAVGERGIREIDEATLISMMMGRNVSVQKRASRPHAVAPSLSLRNVVVPGAAAAVCFDAYAGEVLGFAGLVGAGRSELMQVIAGVTRPRSGTMTLSNQAYAPRSVAAAISAGVCLAPEDRKRHGLVLSTPIAKNISLPDLKNHPFWRLDRAREDLGAQAGMQRLRIAATHARRLAATLSGGNQQKVVLAKWLAMNPAVLVLDEPTRGIDVGAKAEIYAEVAVLAETGMTILLVSSDLEEILQVSDRLVVMRERAIASILARDQFDRETIGALMAPQARAS